jgi:hypothetical protein
MSHLLVEMKLPVSLDSPTHVIVKKGPRRKDKIKIKKLGPRVSHTDKTLRKHTQPSQVSKEARE